MGQKVTGGPARLGWVWRNLVCRKCLCEISWCVVSFCSCFEGALHFDCQGNKDNTGKGELPAKTEYSTVDCEFAGCGMVVVHSELAAHSRVCDHRTFVCKWIGCSVQIKAIDRDQRCWFPRFFQLFRTCKCFHWEIISLTLTILVVCQDWGKLQLKLHSLNTFLQYRIQQWTKQS